VGWCEGAGAGAAEGRGVAPVGWGEGWGAGSAVEGASATPTVCESEAPSLRARDVTRTTKAKHPFGLRA